MGFPAIPSPGLFQPLINTSENGINVKYCSPSVDLCFFVKYYWIVEVKDTVLNTMAQISPSGYPELIFHFGDTVSISVPNNSHKAESKTIIAGQITRPVTLHFGNNMHCICVKLQPYALSPFFNISSSIFTNRAICLGDIMPTMQKDIFDQLSGAKNDHIRIIIIEDYLRKLLKDHNNINAATPAMIDYLRSANNINIEKLKIKFNMGSRTLQRIIMSDVGIPPKMLCRIIRFNKAYNYIKHNQILNLQDISFTLGYYDLSHLINEFKEFSGCAPISYFKKEDSYNSLFAGVL